MKFMFFGIAIMCIILVGGFFIIKAHEETHVKINSYFGIESEVEYGFFGGRTKAKISADREDLSTIQSLHSGVSRRNKHKQLLRELL